MAASSLVPTRTVKIWKDDALDYPELYMFVYIEGSEYEKRAFSEMFVRTGSKMVKTPEEADLVVFTGGADVDPLLYGETQHATTIISPDRDKKDLNLYHKCLDLGIPMFGVCRGFQFLAVMNGCKLYQDLDGHNGEHSLWLNRDKMVIKSTPSVHHQAVRRGNDKMDVLAEIAHTTKRHLNNQDSEDGITQIVEAAFFRETCCLGVQGHPEYAGYNFYTNWVLKQIENTIIFNPDIYLNKQNVRRMKEDLVQQRNQSWLKEDFTIPSLESLLEDS